MRHCQSNTGVLYYVSSITESLGILPSPGIFHITRNAMGSACAQERGNSLKVIQSSPDDFLDQIQGGLL